jgi:HNH endonuclease
MDKCGTYAGYLVHVRAKETSCDDCKKANNEYGKKYRSSNPSALAKKREYDAKWQLNNPEKVKAKYKRYYDSHQEQQIAKSKKWRDENPEKDKATRSLWWKNNLDKAAQYNSIRRARRLSADHSPYSKEEVLATYGTVCYLCDIEIDLNAPRKTGTPGWEMGLHIDHYLSLKHGGTDTLQNVRPTHGICNIRKQSTKIETSEDQ